MKPNVVGRRWAVISIFALVPINFFTACAWTMAAEQHLPPSFAHLVVAASPSVVNIAVKKTFNPDTMENGSDGMQDPFGEMFNRFIQGNIPREYFQRVMGAGFIIDREGYILTTSHLVQDAEDIDVRLSDERRFNAVKVGQDPQTDTALIRIQADGNLESLPFGDSDALKVGDWVVAIGNPFGLGSTVTCGIVSAKYRQIGAGIEKNFIQTDASINPGNIGGPLINLFGEVIGINSALFTDEGESPGIGFAIPINQAR